MKPILGQHCKSCGEELLALVKPFRNEWDGAAPGNLIEVSTVCPTCGANNQVLCEPEKTPTVAVLHERVTTAVKIFAYLGIAFVVATGAV